MNYFVMKYDGLTKILNAHVLYFHLSGLFMCALMYQVEPLVQLMAGGHH